MFIVVRQQNTSHIQSFFFKLYNQDKKEINKQTSWSWNYLREYNYNINEMVSETLPFTSIGGGSMKSKESKSLIPIALSDSIVLAKLVLWISGTAVGSISSLYARSVYSR